MLGLPSEIRLCGRDPSNCEARVAGIISARGDDRLPFPLMSTRDHSKYSQGEILILTQTPPGNSTFM